MFSNIKLFQMKQMYRRQRWFLLVFLVFAFNLIRLVQSDRPTLVENPQPTTVVVGESVTLTCKVEHLPALDLTPVQWVHDGLALGKLLEFWPRYSYAGDSSVGYYNLHISDVQISDRGKFECQVLTKYNNEHVQMCSTKAEITVLVPPTGPVIDGMENSNMVPVVANQVQRIACHAFNANPPATVEWKQNGQVVDENMVQTEMTGPLDSLYNTTTWLTIKPRPVHASTQFSCLVISPKTLPTNSAIDFKLQLMYLPSVSMVMPFSVHAASDLVAECRAVTTEPPVESYEWFKNGIKIENQWKSRMVVKKIDRHWRGAEIGCRAKNAAGFSKTAKKMLDVEYPPILSNISSNASVEIGDDVTLFCQWDSNPPAKVQWILRRGFDERILSTTNKLTLRNVTQQNSDNYFCKASSKIGSSRAVSRLAVLGPPSISSPTTQLATLTATVEIRCEISTTPGIAKVTWMWERRDPLHPDLYDNFKLFSNKKKMIDGTLKFKSSLVPGQQVALLTIYHVSVLDLKVSSYKCSVSNRYGTTSTSIQLTQDVQTFTTSSLNLVPIICEILGGVLFIIIIVFIARFLRRSCRQQKSTNFDDINFTEASKMQGDIDDTKQRPPAGVYDVEPRASISSRGDAPASSYTTSNDGNPTPTSAHDDGYHTEEAGSWKPVASSMTSKLPGLAAISSTSEDDQGSLISDVALNFHPATSADVTSGLRSMSALQQPYQPFRAPYDVMSYGTARSNSVLGDRVHSPPLAPQTHYYPRDYMPLLPMTDAYPIDRVYDSSQSSLEKFERNSLLGNGHMTKPARIGAQKPAETSRPRMATHV